VVAASCDILPDAHVGRSRGSRGAGAKGAGARKRNNMALGFCSHGAVRDGLRRLEAEGGPTQRENKRGGSDEGMECLRVVGPPRARCLLVEHFLTHSLRRISKEACMACPAEAGGGGAKRPAARGKVGSMHQHNAMINGIGSTRSGAAQTRATPTAPRPAILTVLRVSNLSGPPIPQGTGLAGSWHCQSNSCPSAPA